VKLVGGACGLGRRLEGNRASARGTIAGGTGGAGGMDLAGSACIRMKGSSLPEHHEMHRHRWQCKISYMILILKISISENETFFEHTIRKLF
jgi:hypothetical protein